MAEIIAFIATDNPPAAERVSRALVRKTRLLVVFPELDRVVPEFMGVETARELVYRSYRIIYRVDHARRQVEVSRFWHGARGTPPF